MDADSKAAERAHPSLHELLGINQSFPFVENALSSMMVQTGHISRVKLRRLCVQSCENTLNTPQVIEMLIVAQISWRAQLVAKTTGTYKITSVVVAIHQARAEQERDPLDEWVLTGS